MQQLQRIVAPRHLQLLRQFHQRRRRLREFARQQHLPVVALGYQRIQLLPRFWPQRGWNRRQRLMLHHRLRHDHQLPMPPRNIEVVNVISQMIAICEHPAPRAHRQRERQAPLVAVDPRMHPHFHRALAHRARVEELRKVPHKIKMHIATPPMPFPPSTGCIRRKSNRESLCTAPESAADTAPGPVPESPPPAQIPVLPSAVPPRASTRPRAASAYAAESPPERCAMRPPRNAPCAENPGRAAKIPEFAHGSDPLCAPGKTPRTPYRCAAVPPTPDTRWHHRSLRREKLRARKHPAASSATRPVPGTFPPEERAIPRRGSASYPSPPGKDEPHR